MMGESMAPGAAAVTLNEARGWLRMGTTLDDAVVAQLIRAATNICEAFIGRWLVIREVEEEVGLEAGRARLRIRPVVAVDAVATIDDDGEETALAADGWRLATKDDGTGWVAPVESGAATRLRVGYRAGLASGPNDIPEAIRQGIVRLVQHLHEARDDADRAPPAVVAALWQPWRRVGLGGAQ